MIVKLAVDLMAYRALSATTDPREAGAPMKAEALPFAIPHFAEITGS